MLAAPSYGDGGWSSASLQPPYAYPAPGSAHADASAAAQRHSDEQGGGNGGGSGGSGRNASAVPGAYDPHCDVDMLDGATANGEDVFNRLTPRAP